MLDDRQTPAASAREAAKLVVGRLQELRTPGLEIQPGARVSLRAELDTRAGGRIVVGARSRISHGCDVRPYGGVIEIQEDCSIMPFVTLFGHGGLVIGPRTQIAPHAVLVAANHGIAGHEPIVDQPDVPAPIVIGPDCWIAANAVITAGVTIGEGAVVGAGAIVTKDVPAFAVVAGNPARVLRIREARAV